MPRLPLPSPADLLPHDGPMVLLDSVASWDGKTIVVHATLRRRHGFVDDSGVASPLVCIEYMAQAIGCAEGLKRREQDGEEVTVGLLLGTREMKIEVDEMNAGDTLVIRATHAFSNARLASYACEVRRDDQRIASADLNVFAGRNRGAVAVSESPSRRRALVTGASRGIGAAIARELAAAGHPIVLNYRSNDDAAQAVKAEIESAGGSVSLARFDVADAQASAAAIAEILADPRPVGIVVNNAGIARDASFPAMERDAWDAVLRATLDGFYNVTRPLVMPMVRERWGRIVSMSSVSALLGNRGQANYAAAKAGIIGASKSLALELARRGITVNVVAPGLIETDMIAALPKERIQELIPMRRLGRPEEVAKLVAYLVGEDAGYLTGQVISINGGMA